MRGNVRAMKIISIERYRGIYFGVCYVNIHKNTRKKEGKKDKHI